MNTTMPLLENFYDVHSYDVDMQKQLTIPNICKFFQESAWIHAEKLGVGYFDFVSKRKLWVLSRIAFSIIEYPRWGDRISLRTWPRCYQSIFAYREFEIFNSKGKLLIAGTSAWIIIDYDTRRPQRVENYTSSVPVLSATNSLQITTEKIGALKSVDSHYPVQSVYSDLDMNGHVNNTRYIGWIIDSYNKEYNSQNHLKNIAVNYLIETAINEQLTVETERLSEMEYLHSIKRLRDNTEVCRVTAVWEKNVI